MWRFGLDLKLCLKVTSYISHRAITVPDPASAHFVLRSQGWKILIFEHLTYRWYVRRAQLSVLVVVWRRHSSTPHQLDGFWESSSFTLWLKEKCNTRRILIAVSVPGLLLAYIWIFRCIITSAVAVGFVICPKEQHEGIHPLIPTNIPQLRTQIQPWCGEEGVNTNEHVGLEMNDTVSHNNNNNNTLWNNSIRWIIFLKISRRHTVC